MSSPLLALLRRRWNLLPQAEPIIEKLMLAWSQGHTALQLNSSEHAILKNSDAVSTGTEPKPLVLSPSGLLQSWRLHQAEQRILNKLLQLSETPADPLSPELAAALKVLFNDPRDAQSQAVQLGLTRRFALITGGPGTGKTFTAARLLALLALQDPTRRFALAAPTGKAAQRLGASVQEAASTLPSVVASVLPTLQAAGQRSATLHRLLEWRPGADRCAYNQERPLPADVVLVDEASMLDVLLWDSLLQALAPTTHLIVLGDHRQLESVEPGRVLGSLVEAADASGSLKGCHVELKRNHRFAKFPGIAAAADAIRNHQPDTLLKAVILAPASGEVVRYGNQQIDQAIEHIWPQIQALASATQPEVALQALAQIRILCALNEGPWGVRGLNHRIEAKLKAQGLALHAQPILIRVNDAQAGLHNGDLGVLLPTAFGPQAYFPGPQGIRAFNPSSLPQHDLAWAMTVHRSQGSEYTGIVLVLPPEAHELVRPELLYTAVTRAREWVVLVGDEAVLGAGVKARERRVTGLR